MPTPTYALIDSTTITTATTSITLTSIDQSFGDLILVANKLVTGGAMNDNVRFNGDTGSSYNYVIAEKNQTGSGDPGYSTAKTNQTVAKYYQTSYGTSTNGAVLVLQFMDYSATDKHKTVLARNSNPDTDANYGGVSMGAIRWANTAAITSIELRSSNTVEFAIGTTLNLYGIAKAL